ncbi:MAG: energy-coupled thiamine transporter ThiT [Clostridia bacterium]
MESIFTQPFSSLEIFDKLSLIACYSALVLCAIAIVAALIINKRNKANLGAFGKTARNFAAGFAVAFGTIMLALKVTDMQAAGELLPQLFYPIVTMFVVAIVAIVGGLLVSNVKESFLPKYRFIACGVVAIPTIASIVCLAIYYPTIKDDYKDVSTLALVISVIVLTAILIGAAVLFGKKSKEKKMSSRAVAYGAVCIALSFALSYIRIFKLPQGGSITLVSLLPLMLYSYMFGIKKGVIAGLIYGVMQAIQDPWIIHPAQFLLDYPIAFGMIGLTGIFHDLDICKKYPIVQLILGGIVAVTLRYFSHVMSGIFAFAIYADMGFSAVAWGFFYNTFAFVDMAIALVAGGALFASRSFVRQMESAMLGNNFVTVEEKKN